MPVDTEDTLQFLPRDINDSETIQLKLMRKMDYKNPYMHEKISPIAIRKAIDYLLKQPLFREKQINLSVSWIQKYKDADTLKNFVVDKENENAFDVSNKDEVEDEENNSIKSSSDEINTSCSSDTSSDESDYFAPNNKASINAPTMLENQIVVAPGEGFFPKSILFDDDAEELTFLKIYGGNRKNYPKELSYAAICKSEFRRFDRRCAKDCTKLFYSYKKLVACQLVKSINTSLSKTNRTMKLTAQQVLNDDKMKEFFLTSEAKLFLRTIRSSPQYWELKKMEINAMIRQLPCPTFFVTFSPSEIDWLELIVVLVKVSKNKSITIEKASNISREDRIELLANDPVTVARYFENRLCELLKYCYAPCGPFREHQINDYFWRVDFQYRGSPHIHMMLWSKNSPYFHNNFVDEDLFNKNTKLCCEFIDKYITCERPLDTNIITDYHNDFEEICDNNHNDSYSQDKLSNESDLSDQKYKINKDSPPSFDFSQNQQSSFKTNRYEANLKYQEHKHKLNCKENDHLGNEVCKYDFPKPMLTETLILEPFKLQEFSKEEKKDAYETYLQIRKKLAKINVNYKKYNKLIEFDVFLKELNISYAQYKIALRSSIKKSTVFLKRTCRELMLNQYNRDLFIRHRANMDIQFITDPYGAAVYVSAYMLKSNAVMSNLLKKAREEMIRGNNFEFLHYKLNSALF